MHDIDPTVQGWKARVHELPGEQIMEYHDRFTARWHEMLDAGHGACVLRQPALARIVRESLLHSDGDLYEMLSFVVMPNHLHLLVCFPNKQTMLDQCASWKRYMATQINRRLGRRGRLWQQDSFDHLVRHEAQYQRLRQYLSENPVKAGLKPDEHLWCSRDAGGSEK